MNAKEFYPKKNEQQKEIKEQQEVAAHKTLNSNASLCELCEMQRIADAFVLPKISVHTTFKCIQDTHTHTHSYNTHNVHTKPKRP